jgi:hypothetical protein
MIDVDGAQVVAPFELLLDVTPDDPPTVELRLAGVGQVVTRDASIQTLARVNDDHGADYVTLLLVSESIGEEKSLVARRIVTAISNRLPVEQPLVTDLLALRSEDPANRLVLNVGDQLIIQAEVSDRYDLAPREPSRSESITLEIVTPQELLARIAERESELRQTLEGVLSDARRLSYSIDLRRRRELDTNDDSTRPAGWLADGVLQTRKTQRGVKAVAEAAMELRKEVLNNRLDQSALVNRLQGDVSRPLEKVAKGPLTRLGEQLIAAGETGDLELAAKECAVAVAAIEKVLASLESRETYNEVVTMLRGLIRDQRRVNDRTEREQRDEARRLLLE